MEHADCDFLNLVSGTGRPVVLQEFDGTAPLASFKGCTFSSAAVQGEAPTIVITAAGSVRLEDCTLSAIGNGTAVVQNVGGTGSVYSDDATLEVAEPAGAGRKLLQTVGDLEDVPATLTFLSGDDEFIADAREVCGCWPGLTFSVCHAYRTWNLCQLQAFLVWRSIQELF